MLNIKHELITANLDLEVRFYLSVDDGKELAPHWHNSIEIIYILDGDITLKVANQNILLSAETIYIINSKIIHSAISNKNSALVLQIPLIFLEKYIPNCDLIFFNINNAPKNAAELQNLTKLKAILKSMYTIYQHKHGAYLLKFNSLFYDLLYILTENYATYLVEKDIVNNNKSMNKVKHIMLYIDKNHAENISVKDIAVTFGYNADYLSRFFKQLIGMTITRYLYEIRVNHIYKDLSTTDLPIRELFEQHGCSNYKITLRIFKEKYKHTPKDIKHMFQQKSQN